jgi:hypothetical protein
MSATIKAQMQPIMDLMNGLYQGIVKDADEMKKTAMGRTLLKMSDPDQYARLLSSGVTIQIQLMHLPPMSEEQEEQILNEYGKVFEKTKRELQSILRAKTAKVPYTNPYSTNSTQMPDLYNSKDECVWTSEKGVDAYYKKRIQLIRSFHKLLVKNTKFLKDLSSASQQDMLDTIEKSLKIIEFLPPGPTKEAEEERIAYLEIVSEYMVTLLNFVKALFTDLSKLQKNLKFA